MVIVYQQLESDFNYLYPKKKDALIDKLDIFKHHMTTYVFPTYLQQPIKKYGAKHPAASSIAETFETLRQKQQDSSIDDSKY